MLAAGLVTPGVLAPRCGRHAYLLRHEGEDGGGWDGLGSHRLTGIAQVAALHGEPEPIMRATTSANARQIARIQGVLPRDLHRRGRPGDECCQLGGGQR